MSLSSSTFQPGSITTTRYVPVPGVDTHVVYVPGIDTKELFGVCYFSHILPTGIQSAEAFGTLSFTRTHTVSGIASLEEFGDAAFVHYADSIGIASTEAVSSPSLLELLTAIGISSAEVFGLLRSHQGTDTEHFVQFGIASAYASGTASFLELITAIGVSSAQSFGTLDHLDTVDAYGTSSEQTIPNPVIAIAGIDCIGIVSEEAFGAVNFDHIVMTGMPSAYASGVAILEDKLTAIGIASTFACGTADIDQEYVPASIDSAYASGTVSLLETITAVALASLEAFGVASTLNDVTVSGIATSYASGTATLKDIVTVSSIASLEAFGTPGRTEIVTASGITSKEIFGEIDFDSGGIIIGIGVSGIASLEAFGMLDIFKVYQMVGIASKETFGTLWIAPHVLWNFLMTGSIQTVTHTRASPAWMINDSGLAQSYNNNERRISSGSGFFTENGTTNRVTSNRDLTAAAWPTFGAFGSFNKFLDAVGVDGVSGSATTLRIPAGQTSCALRQVPSGWPSVTRVGGFWINRQPGTGTGIVYMSSDSGTTWRDMTSYLTAGEWKNVYGLSSIAATSFGLALRLDGVVGDKIQVDFAQVEECDGNTDVFIHNTSPIYTTSASLARSDDIYTAPIASYALPALARMSCDVTPNWITTSPGDTRVIFNTPDTNGGNGVRVWIAPDESLNLRCRRGAGTSDITVTSAPLTWVQKQTYSIRADWDNANLRIYRNDVLVGTSVSALNLGTTAGHGTSYRFGHDNNITCFNGWVKNYRFYP